METTVLAVRISKELKEKLQELAKSDDRTLSNFVGKLLKEGVMNK